MRIGLLVATLVLSATAGAEPPRDRADLEGTSIIGNRELPKVLYIVPWRPPAEGELVGRPIASLLDEALAPIDREVFRREVQYYEQLPSSDGTR